MNIKFNLFLLLTIVLAFSLRTYKASALPHKLYFDEVSIAYNAHMVNKTGQDEHGKAYPLWFEAFGEYKLPLYIYSVSFSQQIFGKSDFAVRFPSIISGSGTVFVFVLLLLKLDIRKKLALLAGFFLSIAPWHIHFSRAGFEASEALFFQILGVFLLISGIKNRRSMSILFSILVSALAIYTYNVYRVLTPLVLVLTALLYKKDLSYFRKPLITALVLFLLFIVPAIAFSLSDLGLKRAHTVFFADTVKLASEDFFPNKPFHLIEDYFKNYLSYLSLDFLFFSGDKIGRHSTRELGQYFI